jgi:glyoxylase-like metal-dependent hydrolase (beta-lactamase superfamily II)
MTEPSGAARPLSHGRLPYGTIVEIAPDARLVVGRPRSMETDSCDIANVVMYKAGPVLVVIDNGARPEHRAYLNAAADQLRPFREAVLIITHGHADHTGNNAWIDMLGVPARAYMSDHDLATMHDQVATFTPLFDGVRPFMPELPPTREFLLSVMAQFGELALAVKSLVFFETLPLEKIEIGGTIWNGWRLLDGAVCILQTSGHTRGHVAVYLPAIGHLHLADETTGYYQALLCGHAELNLLTLERAAKMFADATAVSLTDGHAFLLRRGAEATAYLERLSRSALEFDAAILRILREHPDGITVADLVAQVETAPEMKSAPPVAEPMPVLNLLRILNKVKELGISVPARASGRLAFPR